MKLIRALIRPEKEAEVIRSLEDAGIFAMTKLDVRGRGIERGVQVGAVSYDELSKLMFMIAVDDADIDAAVGAIESAARTGHPGDGKVFIENIREFHSVRACEKT